MTVMIVLFFLGQPVAKVAIVGGAFLLFTRRVRPQKIYIEIDWPLLVMFVGCSSSWGTREDGAHAGGHRRGGASAPRQ